MFKIGDFSRLAQVSVQTLRYYEEIGLLHPAHIDALTGYRYYTLDLLPRLNRILALKNLGLSLDEIEILLNQAVSIEEIRAMLRLKQAELEAQQRALAHRLFLVEARLQFIELEGNMPEIEVVLKPVPSVRVLSIRQNVPTWEAVPHYFGEVTAAVTAKGFTSSGAWIAIYHDSEWVERDIDLEIALPIGNVSHISIPLDATRALITSEIVAIPLAASLIHQGSYQTKGASTLALAQWIEANGYKIIGAPREVYLRGTLDTEDPAQLMTEIQFPVQPTA